MTKRAPFSWPLPQPGEKTYWRSLEQLSNTKEFREFLEQEFPKGASELNHPISRRSFMHLMGASLALAGLAGCRRPVEKILPYTKQPENLVPGIPNYYATTMALGGDAIGLLAKSNEGRPTKLEGNPDHPSSFGATNVFAQATILDLYDPDRSQQPTWNQTPIEIVELLRRLREKQAALFQNQGEGFYILSGAVTSPTVLSIRERILRTKFPKAKWYTWEPVSEDNSRTGSRIAFGQDLHPHLQLDQAQVIAAFDADFLGLETDATRNARDFAKKRLPGKQGMNRLYVVEAAWTVTGTSADHRLKARPHEIGYLLLQLAHALKRLGLDLNLSQELPIPGFVEPQGKERMRYIDALARDLMEHKEGSSVILVGRNQPAEMHALAHLLNHALGANGKTVQYVPSFDGAKLLDRDSIKELAANLQEGKVDTLLILGSNPAYDAPNDLNLSEKLKQAKLIVHLGAYRDETAALSHVHIPQTHFLESWGDASAVNGTISLVQPLIAPLYQGWSEIELLSFWETGIKTEGYEILRNHWGARLTHLDKNGESSLPDSKATEAFTESVSRSAWNQALKLGWFQGIESVKVNPQIQSEKIFQAVKESVSFKGGEFEIIFPADYSVYDGRFANNGWLQELPDPITKVVWDNAAMISPQTARDLNVGDDDLLTIEVSGRALQAAVRIVPGIAEKTISLPLGYGREQVGRIGKGAGFNAYLLRNLSSLRFGFDIVTSVKKVGKTYDDPRDRNWIDLVPISGLTSTQEHFSMEGRDIIREQTLGEFQKNPKGSHKEVHSPQLQTLWEKPKELSEGRQWGMSIDLSKCIGCGACTIACQAENNIPIVGKAQVRKGREMHWIRVDRYFSGNEENPEAVHQPLGCVHCENAPCENVCPVAATVHSPDGLNEMVYNRCIGTRYCSNNCPYKVRRFNFLDWRGDVKEVEKLKYNPEVTLRSRGVMEKCTYCVQRIRGAQQEAKRHDKATVEDGKITPACAQACPSQAIVFGDIRDPKSRVAQSKRDPRGYDLLADLNTKPRTSYLSRLRNPNPLLEAATKEEVHHE